MKDGNCSCMAGLASPCSHVAALLFKLSKAVELNLNTPDTLVMEYLNRHGTVKSQKVIYEIDKEGPFTGLYNGDRRCLVDFSRNDFDCFTRLLSCRLGYA